MSLKDNFNQALKEILKNEGIIGKNLSEESKKDSSLDSFLGRPDDESLKEAVTGAASSAEDASPRENVSAEEPVQQETAHESSMHKQYDHYNDHNDYSSQRGDNYRDPPPLHTYRPEPAEEQRSSEELTVISKNIMISGGTITGFSNVRVDGSVNGDIRISKDVSLTGKLVGNIECNNAMMVGSSMQGNVHSKGQVRMDKDSVLLGDITTQYLDINGRVKGNIEVSGKAEFKNDAIVIGDINAAAITVLDGAIIKGFVNTTFLQDSSANVFPDTISVSDQ